MNENTAPTVDPSNVDQLRAWDGEQGDFWASRADRIDEGVAGYHDRLLDAAEIEPTSRVLDIGCGAGKTTRDAARRATAGTALGVDLSSAMIDLARRTAAREQVPNAEFLHADAQVHPFPARHFDVAISRHGVMFFGDTRAAFANIARALRPGARLALLTWQPLDRNDWLKSFRTALAAGRDLPAPPPTSGPFSDPDRTRPLIESTGFTDVRIDGLTEPMHFGRDADDALRFVTGQFGGMLADLTPDARARALADLRADLVDHETDQGVRYDSATWLIRARR